MTQSKSEEHIYFLDHLRGIAVFFVFVFHALTASCNLDHLKWNGWLQDFHQAPKTFLLLFPAALGWIGVPIFFIVSGFCIHLSHERLKTKSFTVFFARRFFRIYPPYLVALIFLALFFPLTRHKLDSAPNLAQFGSHLLLIHNFDPRWIFGINASFWSIAIEAQLYLLYPLLLLVAHRFGWKSALWLTGTIEISLRIISGQHPLPHWVFFSPFTFWFSWSIGAALADNFLKGQPLILGKCPLWIWPLATIAFYFIRPLAPLGFPAAALATANLIAYLATRNSFQQTWHASYLSKHIQWVGVISYSVYLIHQPLVEAVPHYLQKIHRASPVHPIIVFTFCLLEWPLVLILSFCFYRCVERYSITLGKWFIRKNLIVDR